MHEREDGITMEITNPGLKLTQPLQEKQHFLLPAAILLPAVHSLHQQENMILMLC